MSKSAENKTLNYLPHLDGLRALAVLAVLLFHFQTPGFSAGYLGVDIFFAISGFLVTRIILKDLEDYGHMRFKRFFARRVRRLFPALAIVCFFTLIIGYFVFSADRLADFGKSIAAAILSVSNINFWSESGYFDTASESKLLLHTWSLSVEEQFYLIWPFTLAIGYKLFKDRTLKYLSIGGFLFSVSLILIWKLGRFDVRADSTIFYWMPFRIFEFMMGAIVILIYDKAQTLRPTSQNLMSVLGLILILATIILPGFYGEPFGPILGFFACLGACLLILTSRAVLSSQVLSLPAIRWIGKISYSLYLVHWPLWVLLPENIKHIPNIWVGLLACSILLTLPIYYLIEVPLRHGKLSDIIGGRKNSDLKFFGIFASGIAIAGAVIMSASSLPFKSQPILNANQIKQGESARYQLKTCKIHRLQTSKNCFPNRPKQILVIGNSHEIDGYNIFYEIFKHDPKVNLVAFSNTNNCDIEINETLISNVSALACSERADALDKLSKEGFFTHLVYSSNQPFGPNKAKSWAIIDWIKSQNQNLDVITLGGFLNVKEHCGTIINRDKDFKACLDPQYTTSFPKNEISESKVDSETDYLYIDKISLLCEDKILQNCEYKADGEPLFYDANHLSFGFSKRLGQLTKTNYKEELAAIGLPVSSDPIYLLVRGEANAIGIPEYPVEVKYSPDENVQIWNGENWVTADPENWPFQYKQKRFGSYNFGLATASKLHGYYDRPVRIILNASSGAKYDKWVDGNKQKWNLERRQIKKSRAQNVIVLSHHGESHNDETATEFLDKVGQYENLLAQQDWFSGLVIHGNLLIDGKKSNQLDQISTLENYVSSEGLTSSDGVNFDSTSLKKLGERYAEQIINSDIIK